MKPAGAEWGIAPAVFITVLVPDAKISKISAALAPQGFIVIVFHRAMGFLSPVQKELTMKEEGVFCLTAEYVQVKNYACAY